MIVTLLLMVILLFLVSFINITLINENLFSNGSWDSSAAGFIWDTITIA